MTKTNNKSKRIITLDLIRGYFLLVILINHLNRFPGLFDIFTGRGQLWTSAAEGFFMISGVLVGMIRGREVKSGRLWLATKKMFTRAVELYFWTVALTIGFTLVGMHFLDNVGLKGGISPIDHADFGTIIGRIVSLRYVYGWADFLQFYTLYMLIAPLFLLLLYRRLAWLAILISVFLFTLKSHNAFLIWQIYFFGGAIIGYYWQEIEAYLRKLSAKRRTNLRFVTYGAALVVLAASFTGMFIYRIADRHNLIADDNLGALGQLLTYLHSLNSTWFNRFDLAQPYGYGRIFISWLWFSALYVFVRRHEDFFKKYLGKLLLPIGCNPLVVYGFDSVIIFASGLIFPHKTSFGLNVIINSVAILLSLGVANLVGLRKKYPNFLAI